jgi:hypothetical protein
MTKTTLANKKVSDLLNLMDDVEKEYLSSKSPRKKAQLTKLAERITIVQEVVRGIISL